MRKRLHRFVGLCIASLVSVAFVLVAPGPARAVTANSIYSYTFPGSSGTVTNNAASNSGVNMTLFGDWTATAFGAHFDGDLVSKQSVGYAKPSSGNTINVPSTSSVGTAVSFIYEAPTSGNCFTDSHNIAQIGRSGNGLGQVKVQLSNCGTSSTNVYPQCRMAGTNNVTSDGPKTGGMALVNGETYVVKCYKDPDPAGGTTAPMTIKTTHITSPSNVTNTASFNIKKTSTITSTAYVSVANKYALPAQGSNTDQFTGEIGKASWCQATTTAAVITCLDTEIPT